MIDENQLFDIQGSGHPKWAATYKDLDVCLDMLDRLQYRRATVQDRQLFCP